MAVDGECSLCVPRTQAGTLHTAAHLEKAGHALSVHARKQHTRAHVQQCAGHARHDRHGAQCPQRGEQRGDGKAQRDQRRRRGEHAMAVEPLERVAAVVPAKVNREWIESEPRVDRRRASATTTHPPTSDASSQPTPRSVRYVPMSCRAKGVRARPHIAYRMPHAARDTHTRTRGSWPTLCARNGSVGPAEPRTSAIAAYCAQYTAVRAASMRVHRSPSSGAGADAAAT